MTPSARWMGVWTSVPTITRVFLSARPSQGDTFARGEPILVGVAFSEPVVATGEPQLTLQVGTEARQAHLHLRRGNHLYFEYVVQASDVDRDGYGVPADALNLEGGSIRDIDGNDAGSDPRRGARRPGTQGERGVRPPDRGTGVLFTIPRGARTRSWPASRFSRSLGSRAACR